MSDQELNNKIADLMKDSMSLLFKKVMMFIVGAAGSGIVAMILFYFSTTNTLANHGRDIQDLKQSKASSEVVQSIKYDIQDIKQQQEKIFNYLLEHKK